jgi:hypothetical protein
MTLCPIFFKPAVPLQAHRRPPGASTAKGQWDTAIHRRQYQSAPAGSAYGGKTELPAYSKPNQYQKECAISIYYFQKNGKYTFGISAISYLRPN